LDLKEHVSQLVPERAVKPGRLQLIHGNAS
jgi:hypothetical protein